MKKIILLTILFCTAAAPCLAIPMAIMDGSTYTYEGVTTPLEGWIDLYPDILVLPVYSDAWGYPPMDRAAWESFGSFSGVTNQTLFNGVAIVYYFDGFNAFSSLAEGSDLVYPDHHDFWGGGYGTIYYTSGSYDLGIFGNEFDAVASDCVYTGLTVTIPYYSFQEEEPGLVGWAHVTASVPEPGSLLLLAVGFVGFVGIRRRLDA